MGTLQVDECVEPLTVRFAEKDHVGVAAKGNWVPLGLVEVQDSGGFRKQLPDSCGFVWVARDGAVTEVRKGDSRPCSWMDFVWPWYDFWILWYGPGFGMTLKEKTGVTRRCIRGAVCPLPSSCAVPTRSAGVRRSGSNDTSNGMEDQWKIP